MEKFFSFFVGFRVLSKSVVPNIHSHGLANTYLFSWKTRFDLNL